MSEGCGFDRIGVEIVVGLRELRSRSKSGRMRELGNSSGVDEKSSERKDGVELVENPEADDLEG